MHLPCHKDDISMAGPHGFVKIMHMYLRTADIWICWFARFAFVKPSRLHLQTSGMCIYVRMFLYPDHHSHCKDVVDHWWCIGSAIPINDFIDHQYQNYDAG